MAPGANTTCGTAARGVVASGPSWGYRKREVFPFWIQRGFFLCPYAEDEFPSLADVYASIVLLY